MQNLLPCEWWNCIPSLLLLFVFGFPAPGSIWLASEATKPYLEKFNWHIQFVNNSLTHRIHKKEECQEIKIILCTALASWFSKLGTSMFMLWNLDWRAIYIYFCCCWYFHFVIINWLQETFYIIFHINVRDLIQSSAWVLIYHDFWQLYCHLGCLKV